MDIKRHLKYNILCIIAFMLLVVVNHVKFGVHIYLSQKNHVGLVQSLPRGTPGQNIVVCKALQITVRNAIRHFPQHLLRGGAVRNSAWEIDDHARAGKAGPTLMQAAGPLVIPLRI